MLAAIAAALGWTVLLGLRDVFVGYTIRFTGGRLSWPHHLWRRSVPLDQIREVTRASPRPDLALVLGDGRVEVLKGTWALKSSDLEAASEAIRDALPRP